MESRGHASQTVKGLAGKKTLFDRRLPFVILINLHNVQKREKEILDCLKETNRLLSEVVNDKKS